VNGRVVESEGPNGQKQGANEAPENMARIEFKDFLAAAEFPSKVHPNVFGIDHRSSALGGKPFGEPLDGRSLRARISNAKRVAEMVTQAYVTCSAMQAAEATNALAIVGRLHDKIKVDRNTVIA
jgi:hypothetical protein